MKALRLLVTILLVALSTGFYSCGKDEFTPLVSVPTDPSGNGGGSKNDPFKDYLGDYSNFTCLEIASRNGDSVTISGLKSKHLWFAHFNQSNKKKLFEWEDMKETDTIQQIHEGYGEYEQLIIQKVNLNYYKKTSTGDIVQLNYLGYSGISGYQTIFTSNGNTKRTSIQTMGDGNTRPRDWYKESIFIQDCCFSHEGDTIYVAKEVPYRSENIQVDFISYKEGIQFYKNNSPSMHRYNYQEANSEWWIMLDNLDVPANAKISYTILDRSTNIWEYKVDVTSYDGTKQVFTFKINIDNGKLINTSAITGTWKLTTPNGTVHTHVTFTKDGTFSYTSANELDYKEDGTYKIVGDLLYQMFSDEDEWAIGKILLLNSETLTLQDLDDDGVTPSGNPYSYQRVE